MKYAVIMYNFNKYEVMRDIPDKAVNKEIEYIYITDDETLTSKNWKIIVDHDLDNLSPFDKCYAVRFNLFKYTSADIIMYVDGAVQIINDVMPYFKKMEESKKELGIMMHPSRSTMLAEYIEWIKLRNYPKEAAIKCLTEMELSDYNVCTYNGLYQGTMRFVTKSKRVQELDSACFALLKKLGTDNNIERLDQTIYSYLINTQFKDIDCFVFSDSCIFSTIMNHQLHGVPFFRLSPHQQRPYIHQGYFRNKLINLVEL